MHNLQARLTRRAQVEQVQWAQERVFQREQKGRSQEVLKGNIYLDGKLDSMLFDEGASVSIVCNTITYELSLNIEPLSDLSIIRTTETQYLMSDSITECWILTLQGTIIQCYEVWFDFGHGFID